MQPSQTVFWLRFRGSWLEWLSPYHPILALPPLRLLCSIFLGDFVLGVGVVGNASVLRRCEYHRLTEASLAEGFKMFRMAFIACGITETSVGSKFMFAAM